jgi:hypothetical protein
MANGKPSGFRTEITIEGVDSTAEEFRAMGERAMMTLPLMERLKEILFVQQRARVQSEPWEPLMDSTIARKVADHEDPSIMRGEWRMVRGGRASRVANKLWLAMTLDGATGQVKRATRTTATFGVQAKGTQQLFYARFAQNNHGKQRRLLAISADDAMDLNLEIAHYIYPASVKVGK